MPLMRATHVLGVVSPPAAATTDGQPPAAAADPPSADLGAVAIGYGAIAAGIIVGLVLWSSRDPAGFTPGQGVSVFAPLYILAQAIERLLEPFTGLINATAGSDGSANNKTAKGKVNAALATGDLIDAANWQQVVDRVRKNTAVVAWGAASCLGIIFCGWFGLYMLRMIGFPDVPKQVDFIVSGLAVGSGTKPLHDLISNLQQAKDSKQDPPEKQSS
jgi:hypothetical protein